MIESIAVIIVATFHVWFFILERFIWNTPAGLKILKMSKADAKASSVLAANQGVYNLLLGLGLFLTVFYNEVSGLVPIRIFILAYIVCCGIYGSITVGRAIFFQQVIPGVVALLFTLSGFSKPMLNDVATDLNLPPQFKVDAGIADAGRFDYTVVQKEKIRKFYPQLSPLQVAMDRNAAFEVIKKLVSRQQLWKIKLADKAASRLQLEIVTAGVGFVDDMVIEVRDSQSSLGGSLVHLRSKSRVGRSDFGANAKRIEGFFQALRTEIYENK